MLTGFVAAFQFIVPRFPGSHWLVWLVMTLFWMIPEVSI